MARQAGADIENEINTIAAINCDTAPEIIDYDDEKKRFCISVANQGERLSAIVGDNSDHVPLDYLYEYGQTPAKLHSTQGTFLPVKDCKFFYIPEKQCFVDLV